MLELLDIHRDLDNALADRLGAAILREHVEHPRICVAGTVSASMTLIFAFGLSDEK